VRRVRALSRSWALLRDTLVEFFSDNALSRGAALAYYTVFAIAPILLIAIAVAGLMFGRAAAQGAVVAELSGLMGRDSAAVLQQLLKGAFHSGAGVLATAIGVVTLLLTATGVFAELQTSLNAIWKAEPQRSVTTEMVRVRLLSLGLVATLGFLLLVALVVSTALQAASTWLNVGSPGFQILLSAVNATVSFLLLAAMFAAIYKVLPDREIGWRDVGVGAVMTALLFVVGKFLISLYIGSSAVTSSYGSAGSLMAMLIWIYYSAQIFLLGAEFTKVFAMHGGSRAAPAPVVGTPGRGKTNGTAR
jgi:membrane protein